MFQQPTRWVLVVVGLAASMAIHGAVAADKTEKGFVALLNGKDLSGWKTTGNWSVQPDGVVAITPRPGERGWTRYTSYLWTEKPYGDFVLDLEFRLPKGGNSGVYFRVKDTTNPASAVEVQILDSAGKQGPLTNHDCGGVVGTMAPKKNMAKPAGEWNRMVVTSRGMQIQVELNGEQIIDLDMEKTPLKNRPAAGHIGLQDHGLPLEFRNIKIKEL